MFHNQNMYQPDPSDPRNIKITNVVMSLPTLTEKLKFNQIGIHPQSSVDYFWGQDQISRLIESILLKIPLPIFYFDVSDYYKWYAINGIKRLHAINLFMGNEFVLTNMEILTHLNGLKYERIEDTYKRILFDTQIITYQIEAQTPVGLRELIFKRIRDMNAN